MARLGGLAKWGKVKDPNKRNKIMRRIRRGDRALQAGVSAERLESP